MPGAIVLETERLVLRELTMGDLDAVEALVSDTDVMRWWPRRFDRDGAITWIEKQIGRYETDGCGYWLAICRRSCDPIGQAGIVLQTINGARLPGPGWIVAKAHWNRGYATEMGAACIAWSFEHREEDTVVAPVQPGNVESEAVARKLGMRVTGRDVLAGLPHDLWTLTREEFTARSLETR